MDMYNSSFRYENYLRNSPESMLNNQNQRQIGQCPSSPGRVFNSNGVQQSSQNMSMTNQSLSFRNFESNCSYDIAGNSVFHQNNSSHFARPINKISKMKNQPRQNQEIQEQTQNSSSIMASCSSSYTKSPQIDPNFQRFNTTRRGAKVYICEVCDKQFIRPSSLSTHRLSHTGEKPHSCSTCGKSFSVASNLRRHEMTLHRLKQPEQVPESSKSCHQTIYYPQSESYIGSTGYSVFCRKDSEVYEKFLPPYKRFD